MCIHVGLRSTLNNHVHNRPKRISTVKTCNKNGVRSLSEFRTLNLKITKLAFGTLHVLLSWGSVLVFLPPSFPGAVMIKVFIIRESTQRDAVVICSLEEMVTQPHGYMTQQVQSSVGDWCSARPRGQWRTQKNGQNWLQNHLWCPNDPRV